MRIVASHMGCAYAHDTATHIFSPHRLVLYLTYILYTQIIVCYVTDLWSLGENFSETAILEDRSTVNNGTTIIPNFGKCQFSQLFPQTDTHASTLPLFLANCSSFICIKIIIWFALHKRICLHADMNNNIYYCYQP